MPEEKKHIVYSAADIQQYLAGKMTAAQMHALEKEALDDPLLADAIDGYEGMKEEDWTKELAGLKEKFATTESTPVIAMNQQQQYKWWKAAAAILLIGGSVSLAYLFTKNKPEESKQVATINVATDSVKKLNEPVFADSVKGSLVPNELAIDQPKISEDANGNGTYYNYETEKQDQASPLIASKDVAGRADSSFIYRPGTVVDKEAQPISGGGYRDDVAVNKPTTQSSPLNNVAVQSNNAAVVNAEIALPQGDFYKKEDSNKWQQNAKQAENRNQASTQFKAQVVTPDNKPVPFANVNILNSKKNTYADANGNFFFAAQDSIAKVEIKSVGYDTKQYTVRSSVASNKIVLQQQNNALNEVVITQAFGTKKAKAAISKAEADSINIAEPVDGWGNYNSYLTNNLKLPDETIKKEIHGEVEVSFDVKSNGTISNVKVDKPLCDNCDEEAIRLVKQGPQWKIKKGKKGTAKVKVQF